MGANRRRGAALLQFTTFRSHSVCLPCTVYLLKGGSTVKLPKVEIIRELLFVVQEVTAEKFPVWAMLPRFAIAVFDIISTLSSEQTLVAILNVTVKLYPMQARSG